MPDKAAATLDMIVVRYDPDGLVTAVETLHKVWHVDARDRFVFEEQTKVYPVEYAATEIAALQRKLASYAGVT